MEKFVVDQVSKSGNVGNSKIERYTNLVKNIGDGGMV